ncbi:MAG TPA: hypothetical protein VFH11_11090 [Gemmatimonadota bacterium]|nr:hypothetical protein [Gemmatimonadota bacterium]
MFVGHYGVSFAAKKADDSIPLWILFLAVQLLDVVWAPLVLLGVEKVRIVPGFTATNPLDLYYIPYTHSLVAAIAWSAAAAIAYRLWTGMSGRAGRGSRGALLVGLAVFSHWVLDFVVHRPDLPLYDDTAKVGIGLWDRPLLAFGLESALVLVGLRLYLARRPRPGVGLVVFSLLMLGIQGMVFFGPPPESTSQIAATALASYLLFALVVWWLADRRRAG